MTLALRLRTLNTLVAATVLLLTTHLGSVAPEGALPWTGFVWHAIDANGQRLEKAALFVPATIAGLPGSHRLQLDTGAHLNFLHGGAVADVDSAFAASLSQSAALSGEVAGAKMSGEQFAVQPGYRAIFTKGEPTPVIGMIGLPFLQHRVLIIDYPRARLAMLDATGASPLPAAAAAVLQKATFLPLEYRNGKIYVPLTVDGETRSDYFFDSGASLFPLVTDKEEWIRLTQRKVDDPRNQRYTLPSLNDKWLEVIGAPMTGSLKIGPVSAKEPMVFFINDPTFRVDRMPNTRGIIGNSLFVREYAVVIDIPGRRIGFIRSADVARD